MIGHDNDDKIGSTAWITVIVCGLLASLLLLIAILTLCVTSVRPCSLMAWILQLLAIMMFYFGDKAPYIVHLYGNELNCNSSCQSNVQVWAIVALAMGLFILHNTPLLHHHKSRRYGAKYKQQWWEHAYSMIAIFLGTDIMYSLLIAFTSISNDSTPKAFLSMLFLVSLFVVGSAGIVINCSYAQLSAATTSSRKNKCDCSLTIVALILVPSLLFYLLSDNVDPLFSIFGCSHAVGYGSGHGEECDMKKVKVIRVALMMIPGVTIALAFIILCCKWCGDKHKDDDPEDDKEA